MGWLSRVFRRGARAPQDVDETQRAALLAVLERDLDGAEALLAEAVRMDSTAVEPYLALGRLYRMRGEVGRAIRVHQNLLLRHDLRPDQTVVALADLAADFRNGGFLQRAIASYEEVLAHDGEHLPALRALVDLHARARDYERSIELLRRLAKLEHFDASGRESALWLDRAEAAQAEGRSDEARKAVKRALRRDPKSARGFTLLGAIEAERGRAKAALAAWTKVAVLDRRAGPSVYPRLEATYASLDRARDYETWLEGLVEQHPADPEARIALARALAARGETPLAIEALRRALDAVPEDLAVRAMLGRMLLAEHRDAEATKAYAELLDALERDLAPREELE